MWGVRAPPLICLEHEVRKVYNPGISRGHEVPEGDNRIYRSSGSETYKWYISPGRGVDTVLYVPPMCFSLKTSKNNHTTRQKASVKGCKELQTISEIMEMVFQTLLDIPTHILLCVQTERKYS